MAKKASSDDATIPEDIAALSFEAALEELEDIVRELETGEGNLDASITGYTRGVHLKQHCEAKLKEAEARIEKIVVGADGTATGAQPFDEE